MEFSNYDINPIVLASKRMTRSTCPPAGKPFPKRTVKWFELELILWGEGYITTEGIDIPTQKGTVFFRTPDIVVQGYPPYSCNLIIFDMVYDQKRLHEYQYPNLYDTGNSHNSWSGEDISFDKNSCFRLPYSMNPGSLEYLESLFEKSYQDFLLYERGRNALLQKSVVIEILNFIWEQNSMDASGKMDSVRANRERIKVVMSTMDRDPSISYSLDTLAAMASLSPNFFCSIFKKVSGISPFVYLNKARIRMATRMLMETKMPIKEISMACGFQNETYFYTTFKRFQGQTPQSYRNSVYWADLS